MKTVSAILICVAIVCFIVCGLFAEQAIDKYTNYRNSESFTSTNVNAYVGGDAYNYIINGTHFTAFTVAASASAILGMIALVGGLLIWVKVTGNWYLDKLIDKQDKVIRLLESP